ncbi:MAG TPA: maleylpyruvate isomerase family mycothiol-dependent enzyme [Actinomycetota bacterium]|nr:maleylpyruvate isomerase family mycothiol-dependent enzyme [Actinomycetota bacterium]
MLDLARAYEDTQRSVAEFVRGLSEEQRQMKVPASPSWSVQDVVAHVAGLAGDVAYDRAPPELDVVRSLTDSAQAALRDEMTEKQVVSRRGRSLDEILDEWTKALADLIPMIHGERPFPRSAPFIDAALVTDLATHNQDIRNGVGVPGDRDSEGVSVAFVGYSAAFALRVAQNGLPALRLKYDGKERIAGQGEPRATLTADRYELYRALAGRRSRDQILQLNWDGDPEPYADLMPAYGPRTDPLEE